MPHLLDDPAALAEAADANLAVHAGWAQRRTPGMRVLDDDALVLVDSGLPCDTFNVICRARLTDGAAAARVGDAVAYFATVGRPFSWWVGPADRPANGGLGALLEAAGLVRAEGEVAMAADLGTLRPGEPAPRGLTVRRVRTREELADFARVNAANWTPPDVDVLVFYDRAAPALLADDSPLRFYVGYADGRPVATAELAEGGGVVGLHNIATLEAHRRRGFGSALTLRALLDGLARGHRTAVLQAAPDGVGVYTRVGFRPFGEVTEYKPPAAPGAG
jgi:ribosomal protein S18 acetylase RimI-like enzyme